MNNLTLTDIELYYSTLFDLAEGIINVDGEECIHILNVMRHKVADDIFVTNGEGKIFKCQISRIKNRTVEARILNEFNFKVRFANITFCIPNLRNKDRLEFALEKCTELGVTNFYIFQAERSVSKGLNQKRIEKILISAMKQSLLSWLPKVKHINSIKDIYSLTSTKIIFDQSSTQYFDRSIIQNDNNYVFVFGPEGGLTLEELRTLSTSERYKLADNRLRSETAIIKAASML